MEYDSTSDFYHDQAHDISATFHILVINDTIFIEVNKNDGILRFTSGYPTYYIVHAIKSMHVLTEHKSNKTTNSYSIAPNSPLQISSYGDFLYKFEYSYSYSYTSCSEHGLIYCEATETKTESGDESTEYMNFQINQPPTIKSYNLIYLLSIITVSSLIIIGFVKKRPKIVS